LVIVEETGASWNYEALKGKAENLDFEKNRQRKYVVESILQHKTENTLLEFLVRWKGYPEEEASWEPFSSLKHVQIFQAYCRTHDICQSPLVASAGVESGSSSSSGGGSSSSSGSGGNCSSSSSGLYLSTTAAQAKKTGAQKAADVVPRFTRRNSKVDLVGSRVRPEGGGVEGEERVGGGSTGPMTSSSSIATNTASVGRDGDGTHTPPGYYRVTFFRSLLPVAPVGASSSSSSSSSFFPSSSSSSSSPFPSPFPSSSSSSRVIDTNRSDSDSDSDSDSSSSSEGGMDVVLVPDAAAIRKGGGEEEEEKEKEEEEEKKNKPKAKAARRS